MDGRGARTSRVPYQDRGAALTFRKPDVERHFAPGIRRAYLRANVFELWLAMATVVGALVFFAVPEALQLSVIGRWIGWAYVWNAGYLAGGLLTTVGLWRPWVRGEVAGLCLLAAAVAIQGLASFALRGLPSVAGVLLLVGLVVACLIRCRDLLRISRRVEEDARRDG